MEALGNVLDIAAAFAPVDGSTAAITGKRVSLRNAGHVSFVVNKGIGTAGDDPVFTLKQHTASTGGTTANLAIIDHYYLKTATTPGLLGSETWTRVAQTASATITDPGGAGTSAESQQILVIEVDAQSLSDGYTHVSLDVADVGTNAQLVSGLAIRSSLHVNRAPQNLSSSLA